VLELTAPAGVALEILDTESGAQRMREVGAGDEPVFVIMRSPTTALQMREAGVEFDVLNVGGIGAGPDRKPLYRNISASAAELDAMRRLEQLGTNVELRIVAGDKPVAFSSVDPG
jgi:PTS system mannose-specific IIB component